MNTMQFFLTPAAGKALIAKALVTRTDIREAMERHTLVITGGTTNSYIAAEVLAAVGTAHNLGEYNFFRGVVKPEGVDLTKPQYEGDVVIKEGKWLEGKTIQDVLPELGAGDVILKGANAVNLEAGEAGVLVGNPLYGTMKPVTEAVIGRRVKLVIPVGVEKRVTGAITKLALRCNDPDAPGVRFSPMPGMPFTELDAIRQFGGTEPQILAAGGVAGAEGGCWFLCGCQEGAELPNALDAVKNTPAFSV